MGLCICFHNEFIYSFDMAWSGLGRDQVAFQLDRFRLGRWFFIEKWLVLWPQARAAMREQYFPRCFFLHVDVGEGTPTPTKATVDWCIAQPGFPVFLHTSTPSSLPHLHRLLHNTFKFDCGSKASSQFKSGKFWKSGSFYHFVGS